MRTLTRATYATKPSVAETSQKWRVLRALSEMGHFWRGYLIELILGKTHTRALVAIKASVTET